MDTNEVFRAHAIVSSGSKGDLINDSAPMLVATPLYGTDPEIVTFDEAAAIPVAATTLGGERYETDPLLIGASASADYSSAHSARSEESAFRDVPFAVLFWLQMIAVLMLGLTVAPKGFAMVSIAEIKEEIEKDGESSPKDLEDFETFATTVAQYVQVYPQRIIIYLLYPTSILAFLIALVVTTKIIRPYPKFMVTMCLVGIFLDAAIILGIMVLSSMSVVGLAFAMVVLSILAYYIRAAWRLIPHSAVNLGVALEGVQSNCGIYVVALILAEIGFFWAIYWFYVLVGTVIYVGETQCPDLSADDDDCGPQGWIFLLMLPSFYWTSQVISNTIQVTVAGVMATWCFDYDFARNWCSSAVISSLYRSLTFSFGSICFGSLLMAIVQVIRHFVENAKKHRDGRNEGCDGSEMLRCILDCLISVFEEILEYFNHWSYVFCGIYGYSYLESGKMVVALFRARGWTTIVTEDLIGHVLAFTTFSVGLLTGLGCMCLERIVDSMVDPDPVGEGMSPNGAKPWEENKSYLFGPLPHPQFLALGFGFLIGVIVCSIMMNVVRGAVNTLIVCWADSPARLEENHPDATKEMAEAWSRVFPDARVHLSSIVGP